MENDQTAASAERRAPQRDWLVHSIQAAGIVVAIIGVLGVPLVIMGANMNTNIATTISRQDRQEKDIAEQRQMQMLVTNQIIEVNKVLVRLDTLLDLRGESKATRR